MSQSSLAKRRARRSADPVVQARAEEHEDARRICKCGHHLRGHKMIHNVRTLCVYCSCRRYLRRSKEEG